VAQAAEIVLSRTGRMGKGVIEGECVEGRVLAIERNWEKLI